MEITKIDDKDVKLMENYLERFVDEKLEGEINIFGYIGKVVVKNSELFYNILKNSQTKKLKNTQGNLNYTENRVGGDYWTICLDSSLNEEFIKKYWEKISNIKIN